MNTHSSFPGSRSDLHRTWERIVHARPVRERLLWFVVIDADGRCTNIISQIDDLPELPEPEGLDGLVHACGQIVNDAIPGGSIAFMLSRPGFGGPRHEDRLWAAALLAAAERGSVACRGVHFANSSRVREFAPDDLVGVA